MKWMAFCFIALIFVNGWATTEKGSSMQNHLVKSDKIRMRVGSNSFEITLIENDTTNAFKARLPLTIRMKDLHSNEKHFDLPKALPTHEFNPNTIEAGDIMLYGSKTLVLFYKSFPTAYSYTRLGKVSDALKLESALGSDDITLTFEFEK